MEGQQQPASSQVNQVTGVTDVSPDIFLSEEEQASEETSHEQGGQATDHDTKEAATPAEATQPQPEPTTEPSEAPTLYAGKFKTEDALREAFTHLGGNPAEYADAKMLEQAYAVREREFSRARQQVAELERLEQTKAPSPDGSDVSQELITQVADRVDWSSVKDAKDLFVQTLKAVTQLQEASASKQKAELIQQVSAAIQTREDIGRELSEVEADVPRLKSDPEFREAFAYFIQGQKTAGRYQNLKTSMKSFLNNIKKVQEEALVQNGVQQANKAAAQSPAPKADGAAGQAASSTSPEVDEIIGAYAERKSLFG